MDTCTIEVGLLRKKPCGHPAVTKCQNCEQPLCLQHAVPLMADGKKTGKFMCQECFKAHKEHDKAVSGAARHQEEKKKAEFEKNVRASMDAPPPPPKKPAAPAAPAAGTPAPAAPAKPAAEKPAESDALEFTPKDGKFGYTPKKD